MGKSWKKHLDKVVPYKPGKPIQEVKRELGLEHAMKLASNENPMPPSPKVIEAIKKNASEVNRYPEGGCFYLREALSKKLGITPDNLVFGNGSDEIIVLALHAFVDPKDEVVVATPTFMVYHIASMVKGATVKTVPLKGYKYDLDAMRNAVTESTKVVFIANPDNPTGSYVTQEELDAFIENIPKDVLVFIDEAYYELAKGDDYPESIKYVKEKRNVVIARTFSKAYSLAGLRVGYGIAREDIAEVLNKVREPFNVNSIAQVAALAALEDEVYMEQCLEFMGKEKERYYDFLRLNSIEYVPSRTNFILINTKRDSVKVYEYLLSRGMIVREMSTWGLKGFIRVNMGLEEENNKFFKVFKEALEEIPVL